MVLYKVECRRDIVVLQNQVNELLNMGWQLHGGIAISSAWNGTGGTLVYEYAQALTLEVE